MIRGRKRRPGSRHPCGKRIHAETEREIMQTAIDARQRHYGVTARQARDARLGTSLGRLAYQELISSVQYEAGRQFRPIASHQDRAPLVKRLKNCERNMGVERLEA
jgi:hypothetical protein